MDLLLHPEVPDISDNVWSATLPGFPALILLQAGIIYMGFHMLFPSSPL